MLDIKFIRENPDIVKENIKKKFQDQKLPLVDEVIALDAENRAAIAEAHTALRLNVMLWNTWSYNVRKSLSMKDNDAAKKHLGPEHYQEYLDYFVTHCSAIREAHSLTNDELLQQIFEVRDKHDYFFMIFIDPSGIVDVMDNSREAIDRDAYYTLDGRRLVSTPSRSGLYIHGGRKLLVK